MRHTFNIFSPRLKPLKHEEVTFSGGKVILSNSETNNGTIDITFDDQPFDQDGNASFLLRENGIVINLHSRRAGKLPVKNEVDITNSAGVTTTQKEDETLMPQIVENAEVVGLNEENATNVVGKENAKQQGHLLKQELSVRPLRTMLFDNVSWKEPHSMTLEEFSALNRNMRYGEIGELSEEEVEFEAGQIRVSPAGISVDTRKWSPEKGGGGGQFYVELPINGIKLSLFVFRPVSELLSFKEVNRKEVPYPKEDEDCARGSGGPFQWMFASTRGPSHRNSDTLYRDDDVRVWYDEQNDTLYSVVADGAGSAKYAREGSRIAVEGVIEYFKGKPLGRGMLNSSNGNLLAKQEVHRAVLNKVLSRIDDRCKEISSERNEPNLTRRSLHSTLNLAIVQKGSCDDFRVLTFAIGDGAVVFCKNDGTYRPLSVPDRGAFASQTAFITSSGSIPSLDHENLQTFYENRFGEAVISADEMKNGYLALMTDGVSEDIEDWRVFIAETKNALAASDAKVLLDWLNAQIERNLDDKTLVLLSSSK